jgi:hypothetical protein
MTRQSCWPEREAGAAWRGIHPCNFGPLSKVTVEMIDVLFAALPALLERHGARVGAGERFGAPGTWS